MVGKRLSTSLAFLFILSFFLVPSLLAAPDCDAAPAPGVDWSGCDFSSVPKTLVGPSVSLAGANLSGTNLSGSTFFNLDMSGATLTGADFSGASIVGVDLSGAHIDGLDLDGAVVSFVDFTGADGEPENVDQAATFAQITCPDESTIPPDSLCSWVPTAVNLSAFGGSVAVAAWPAALIAALALASTAVWLQKSLVVNPYRLLKK